ncbi:NAD-dependent epimerase/dehydratase family protein [Candidatus Woesearchaeota archaeon]|jgi:nucleoside-diphosphate-sugar epimerase|nr:NAD-dependent epimerase/dehydratase family protein [Candidatus Woesearchaeota archaeon]MBT5397227.1 NAD-dependent epimerase/dehydratase family protein [Candidatus Woesearchaeota archaeon]MBT6367227.1 NAD-dependent epimerase/dehydratase family protein [Candidatus Woesearchaeota archaeon]MBT7762627.1 NAD-dependent epimerase/dehydratase family protein [Candidatus Woesearchaeota archaeon]
MIEINSFLVMNNFSIKDTMRIIGNNGLGIAFVTNNEGTLLGTVTDGDIRKALGNGTSISTDVEQIMNTNPITVQEEFTSHDLKNNVHQRIKGFSRYYTLKVPVVDNNKKVVNIVMYNLHDNTYELLKEFNSHQTKDVKKVLVVGGAGYIGSTLCHQLIEKGYDVRVLDKMTFGHGSISELQKLPNFELLEGDLRNITTITSALENIDAVILLAGIVGDPASSKIPKETIETNYFATLALANACKYYQINRFVFASTCSVYGSSSGIVTEEDALNPLSLYARSKIDSEQSILNLKDTNFAPTMLRMATVYGLSRRMRFDLVVNIFALKAATGDTISIFGGDQWRPFVHVEDAASAYIKCLEAPLKDIAGETFNIGAENYTINQLGEFAKELFPEATIEKTDKQVIKGALDSRDYKVSFAKAKRIIKFEPQRTVKKAMLDIKNAIEQGSLDNFNDKAYYNVEMAEKKSVPDNSKEI